jgi:hypothetical protein
MLLYKKLLLMTFSMTYVYIHIHKEDSNENLKSVIKTRNTAQFSCKLATGGSTMQECNKTAQ